jgi:membrane protein YdbS with pleckstrin-like domain
MTAPAGGPRTLDPKQVQVWRVGWGLAGAAVVAAGLSAELLVRLLDGGWPLPPGALPGALALLVVALVWLVPPVAFDRWRYELADATLELHRGVVVHTHTAIPYFRVQHIDITRSPIERALGLSQLVVRTAAASTDATIPGVAVADADELRRVILARTGRGDAV